MTKPLAIDLCCGLGGWKRGARSMTNHQGRRLKAERDDTINKGVK